MKAEEAGQIAKKKNIDITSTIMAEVRAAIHTAAHAGKYTCSIYKSLNGDVIKLLRDEGYKVNDFYDQRDGILVTISWSI